MKMEKVGAVRRIAYSLLKVGQGVGVLAAVFLLVVVIQQLRTVNEEEYIPSMFGCTYLNALSDSMTPVFSTYDLVIGRKTDAVEDVRIGDIITFRDGHTLVTHRVVRINQNGGLVTRGDANDTDDAKAVTSNALVSKYVVSIPKAGYLVAKLQDPVFLLVLWIVTMFVIIRELVKEIVRYKAAKEVQKKKEGTMIEAKQ